MVCPMRFVLVGLSAVVALGFALVALNREVEPDVQGTRSDDQKKGKQRTSGEGCCDWRRWMTVLFDWFSGRYLWQTFRQYQGQKAHVKKT
ncbi:hypothetical protein BSKO_12531 [Bryopsis sp. KO-2023]|nr:hypothetical protein BSKO_12531 [Bryopsis sp. KO-2023]